MQHQYWLKKKAVQRQFGSKEDDHIISSDTHLDVKLEMFQSIVATGVKLSKIIDKYSERIYVLSQDENTFGRFMTDAGKRSRTTGQNITKMGHAIMFNGQHKIGIRLPLMRLQHEITIFRNCAIRDTEQTIIIMEKKRTEYRAALEWLKSISEELDPDSAGGLNMFRSVQSHVRLTKGKFDKISLDSVQKIDLLTAARCNMLSHVLIYYIHEIKHCARISVTAIEDILQEIDKEYNYDFHILRMLKNGDAKKREIQFIVPIGEDTKTNQLKQQLIQINDDCDTNAQKIEKLTDDTLSYNKKQGQLSRKDTNKFTALTIEPKANDLMFMGKLRSVLPDIRHAATTVEIGRSVITANKTTSMFSCDEKNNTDNRLWIKLFTELDPLINLSEFDEKLNERSTAT